MQIILPCLSDPFDCVLQGAQDQSGVLPLSFSPLAMISLIEGDMFPISYLPIAPIPSWEVPPTPEGYGVLPRQIGPMAIEGGTVVNLIVGTPAPASIFVDPIQQFLNQTIPQDLTGQYLDIYDDTLGILDFPPGYIIPGNSGSADLGNIFPLNPFPPAEILMASGLRSLTTYIVLPPTFGNNLLVNLYTDTTQRYIISGVTRDNGGNPLGNCQIFVMDVSRMFPNAGINANPIVAIGTSDNAGNYSIQVGGNNLFYQVIGYLPGNPDVGGITVDSITPTTG